MTGALTVTWARCEEESEDRFEIAGIGYANVIDQGYRLWLAEFHVHSERGNGYGTVLLNAVITRYRGQLVTLSAEPIEDDGLTGDELIAWYERHGFELTGGEYHEMDNRWG